MGIICSLRAVVNLLTYSCGGTGPGSMLFEKECSFGICLSR